MEKVYVQGKSAETRISNACGFVSMFYTRFTVGTCISHTGADFGSRLPAMMDARYKSQLYLFCSHFRFKGPGIVLIICRRNFKSKSSRWTLLANSGPRIRCGL